MTVSIFLTMHPKVAHAASYKAMADGLRYRGSTCEFLRLMGDLVSLDEDLKESLYQTTNGR